LRSRHEEIPETVLSGSGDDNNRGFKRTHVRTRRGCRKYHELPGLSAAASGIQTAGVTTRRATVCDPSTQNGDIGVSTDVLLALSEAAMLGRVMSNWH
jgi:hypothetical protein